MGATQCQPCSAPGPSSQGGHARQSQYSELHAMIEGCRGCHGGTRKCAEPQRACAITYETKAHRKILTGQGPYKWYIQWVSKDFSGRLICERWNEEILAPQKAQKGQGWWGSVLELNLTRSTGFRKREGKPNKKLWAKKAMSRMCRKWFCAEKNSKPDNVTFRRGLL